MQWVPCKDMQRERVILAGLQSEISNSLWIFADVPLLLRMYLEQCCEFMHSRIQSWVSHPKALECVGVVVENCTKSGTIVFYSLQLVGHTRSGVVRLKYGM
jgi:hypothetical protein